MLYYFCIKLIGMFEMAHFYGKRTAAAVLAAVIACGIMSGCGIPSDSDKIVISADAKAIADEYFPGDSSSFPAWKDTDRSKVIASVDEPEHIGYFDITFGDFIGEYMYYLMIYGITDDMSDANAESCKNYRVNIINYLIFEKLYLYAAEKDYGISESSLTEEQKEQVRKTAEQVRSDWATNFYETANAKLGGKASSDEIDRLCNEALEAVLQKCGINDDIFYKWELSSKIQELAREEMLKGVTVSDELIQSELDRIISEAKEAAENNITEYERNVSYQMAYVPDGTRKARHIRLTARDGESKDELLQRAKDTAQELRDGADFPKLLEDHGGADEHISLVCRDSSDTDRYHYSAALYGINEKGGVAMPVENADGSYSIIQYTDDASGNLDMLKMQLKAYLKSNAENNVQIDAYDKWTNEYKYNIDCDTLKVAPEDIVTYGITSSGIIG